MCLLAYRTTYNAFFIDLPVYSFVSHSSLLTMGLAVEHAGFPSEQKSSVFLIVAYLIAEVLFEGYG